MKTFRSAMAGRKISKTMDVHFSIVFAALLSLASPRDSLGQSLNLSLAPVNPAPNGIVDLGTIHVDTRMITYLKFQTDVLRFSHVGQTQAVQVLAVINDGSAYDVTAGLFGTTYSVSPSTVAIIDNNGNVTATGNGIAILNVNFRGLTGLVLIQVDTNEGERSIQIQPAALTFSFVGQNAQLSASLTYADGSSSDVTFQSSTTYQVANSTVASISQIGAVTAVGSGQTTILINYGAFLQATVPINVSIPSNEELAQIILAPSLKVLRQVGTQIQLTVEGMLADGRGVDLTSNFAGVLPHLFLDS